jgi:hypothetical protein
MQRFWARDDVQRNHDLCEASPILPGTASSLKATTSGEYKFYGAAKPAIPGKRVLQTAEIFEL